MAMGSPLFPIFAYIFKYQLRKLAEKENTALDQQRRLYKG